MRRLFKAIGVLFLSLAVVPLAFSQCVNTATPSCGVYEKCFADRCDCKGSQDEYFITYGKKYCERFLDIPGLSAEGKKWRDSTLKCLQEEIVPILPDDGKQAQCDCAGVRNHAFESHVKCYTKPSASICNLPKSDWIKIIETINPLSMVVDKKGMQQAVQVFAICRSSLPEEIQKRGDEAIAPHRN